jgi:Ribbon-helix-helix protein, copG family
MKTAISLPDDLFAAADALAERLGMSRSKLFANAVAEFVAKHQGRRVTSRLDAIYGDDPGGLDPALRAAQTRTLGRGDW